MKKVAVLLIALMLMFASIAYGEGNPYTFEPSTVNLMDFTGSRWYGTSYSRALFTVMLAIDYAGVDDGFDASAMILNDSYVAMDNTDNGIQLTAYYVTPDNYLYCIIYYPSLRMAIGGNLGSGTESLAEYQCKSEHEKYEKNDHAEISDAIHLISETLSE